MSDLRTAAQQALEALEWFNRYGTEEHGPSLRGAEFALRAALAEDAMQKLTDIQQEMERTGCDHCRSLLWCGTKCKSCGRKA